ncbi:MAG TPA: MarR family transcriptional regulator [Mycobacterium sp.]|nr:MarR family transcriptional regulator [Mycobacterium sp.]
MKDGDSGLASDLSLAVMRLARQLRFRRPESPITLSQLSAMTPGALAARERVSMTRVVASLVDLGPLVRTAHPADGRQILVAASPAGAELVDRERRASQDWLRKRLATLGPEERDILLQAADLMTVLVDEDA